MPERTKLESVFEDEPGLTYQQENVKNKEAVKNN